MANMDMSKFSDTLGDAMKLAANLSEATKKENKMDHITDNSTTQTQTNPNQTVQIQIADPNQPKPEKKPVIIREKPETHIHKEFPDDRALTDKECELALAKAKMNHELEIMRMDKKAYADELNRRDRLEREARELKEREERRKKQEKRQKIGAIIAGIFGVAAAAAVGYGIYSDNRNQRAGMANATTTPPIPGEGNVE